MSLAIPYNRCFIPAVILACLVLVGCKKERREEIISRYDSGRKKIVLIYEGEGASEELMGRYGYSSQGDLVWSTAPWNGGNFWAQKPDSREKGKLLQILSGYDIFVSKRKIKHRGQVVAIETMRIAFRTKNEIGKQVSVDICDIENEDIYTWSTSRANHTGESYIKEKDIKFHEGIPFQKWESFVEGRRYLQLEDFAFSLFSFSLSNEQAISGTKIESIGPYFFFDDDDTPAHVKDSGGFSIDPLFNSKDTWVSTEGNEMEDENLTDFGPQEIRNKHEYFVEKAALSDISCP